MKTKNNENKGEQPTKLNEVQLQLLQLFSRKMTKKEIREIKALLLAYYDDKLQKSLDKLAEQKGWDDSIFDKWLNEHERTPYQS